MTGQIPGRWTYIEKDGEPLPYREGGRGQSQILQHNYAISVMELEKAGFTRVCGWVSGLSSGSSWMNDETLEIAEILVRNWNRVEYRTRD